jgi:hypothetical protein
MQTIGNSIFFECPACRQRYEGDSSHLGTEMNCHACKTTIRIPGTKGKGTGGAPRMVGQEILDGPLTCPHCWQKFSKAHIHYISVHPDLVGDPILGDDAQRCFLPTVYNSRGLPLDANNMTCTDMACPRCHLRIPTTIVDVPSIYVSMVGENQSGKSYLLTAMTHYLKDMLATEFNLNFSDADPQINRVVNEYERILFQGKDPKHVVILPKTQQVGANFSSTVLLDGMSVDLPKPYVFALNPLPSYSQPKAGNNAGCEPMTRNAVFYDNSGEHFQPGNDVVGNPATKHLIHSDGIMFLFDPTADAKMRQICDPGDPQVSRTTIISNQSVLMAEMITRIRRHGNMKADQTTATPLVIVVAKYDIWRSQFPYDVSKLDFLKHDDDTFSSVLDTGTISNISFHLRRMMTKIAPSIIGTAEAFFENVIYLPVSVFGTLAVENKEGAIGVRPADMKPIWVGVPVLYLLSKMGLVPTAKPPAPNAFPPIPNCRISGNSIQFPLPGEKDPVKLPISYAGTVIEIDGTSYCLPQAPAGKGATGRRSTKTGSFWDK